MRKRLFVLSVMSSLLALSFIASSAMATHGIVGAGPIRVSLVPAYQACDPSSANSTHGTPLNFQSCHPPVLVSDTAKAGPNSLGYAFIIVCNAISVQAACNESAPGFLSSYRPDVRLFGNGRDVQCRVTATPAACTANGPYNPVGATGPYTTMCINANCNNTGRAMPFCRPIAGSEAACIAGTDITATATLAQASGSTGDVSLACSGVPPTQLAQCIADKSKFLGHAIRITDHYNCGPIPPPCTANVTTSNRQATVVDLQFPVPVDCRSSHPGDTSAGSNCGTNTTANALVPGSVVAGKQAIVEVGEVQQLDAGPDGARGNTDDQILSVQGIYLP